jgi:hypothetical protein
MPWNQFPIPAPMGTKGFFESQPEYIPCNSAQHDLSFYKFNGGWPQPPHQSFCRLAPPEVLSPALAGFYLLCVKWFWANQARVGGQWGATPPFPQPKRGPPSPDGPRQMKFGVLDGRGKIWFNTGGPPWIDPPNHTLVVMDQSRQCVEFAGPPPSVFLGGPLGPQTKRSRFLRVG